MDEPNVIQNPDNGATPGDSGDTRHAAAKPARSQGRGDGGEASSYWLTRFMILRLLGFIYFIAFLVAANQIVPLVGEHGLLPAKLFLNRVEAHFNSRWEAFWQLPGLFWFNISDNFMVAAAWAGAALAFAVLLGYANAILMAALWALYLSFVHIGQDWYSYGWEIQLLETGLLAIFLCPLFDGRPFPRRAPPATLIWLFRWLAFRIMLGAGLIKIRGDSCWRDLTCLYYHYETQPIPNPLSRALHFMPHWFHKLSVLWNHFVELVVPWFAFGSRGFRHMAGLLLVSFQIILILSGNLSFLNWLTIVPMLACFDDSLWRRVLPRKLAAAAARAAEIAQPSRTQDRAAIAITVLVALLSIFPVANMLSPGQIMNTSFNRLHLVNTYGAFGSVGRDRLQLVFEGTDALNPTEDAAWREYEFKGQPGDLHRRPCIVAPYQYRLDWQLWFAAMSTPEQYPWTLHFVWQLLHHDADTLGLLAHNPFPNHPPRYVRAVLYRYEFARPGGATGLWWKRTRLGLWLPPLSAEDPELRRILTAFGWLRPGESADPMTR